MFLTTKELCDDNTPYSTTRWSFVTCTKVAIFLVIASVAAFVAMKILNIDIDEDFLTAVGVLIGIILGIPTVAKSLQGFERRDEPKVEKKDESEPVT